MQYPEIRNFLKERSDKKAKESWRRFVPTSEKVHGVYVSELNKIVTKCKPGGFSLVEDLWKSRYLEERILAAKLLGKICKQDPDLTLKLITRLVEDIADWAVCDTLATQGIRQIAEIRQKELFKLSQKLIRSENIWKRRFGIVLLTNFKNKGLRKEIKDIIKQLETDKEHYIKKALDWIKKDLRDHK